MNLNEKIKQILADKNISPSHFADEIGIQRSSVSHILAGRNKPSLDIVQKVIKRFPELGMNWILEDEDLPEIKAELSPIAPEQPRSESNKVVKEASLESHRNNNSGPGAISTNVRQDDALLKIEKKIERVMIFYSDGTFQDYKQ